MPDTPINPVPDESAAQSPATFGGLPFDELLRRWCSGEAEALGELLRHELPWLTGYVSRRVGALLRRRGETDDFVQEAALDALRAGPRFVVADRGRFRALLARIVENNLRDRHERFTAARRDVQREFALGSGSAISLDPSMRCATQPSEAAAREEMRAWVRLALELLEPEDRRIVLLRGYQELDYAQIAELCGITVGAAQMRFSRALPRLAKKIEALQQGQLDAVLADPALRGPETEPERGA